MFRLLTGRGREGERVAWRVTRRSSRGTARAIHAGAIRREPHAIEALVERDIDILAAMAKERLVSVTLSVTTLDNEISRRMEPRTSAPARRLKAIERLAAAGIPVSVNVAPVVPFLTDSEMEPILEAAAKAGATGAGYHLMRLPWEVKDIFKAWLEEHFPLKAAHVMSRVREMREGRENDPDFGSRMTGTGSSPSSSQALRDRLRALRLRARRPGFSPGDGAFPAAVARGAGPPLLTEKGSDTFSLLARKGI
jgi:DNA repair photolyase